LDIRKARCDHRAMPFALKSLDWKVVFLALLVCYLVPGIVLAAALAVVNRTLSADALTLMTALLAIVSFAAPPVAGGYLTARYARSQPWRHVLIVGALGAVLSLLAFRATPRAMVLYVLASLALAAFGGYIRLQGRRRG
jgi:lysylphosphatidylglycerol synthetase-like protein (DUF2156 family)